MSALLELGGWAFVLALWFGLVFLLPVGVLIALFVIARDFWRKHFARLG
jgi:hypothetical protein